MVEWNLHLEPFQISKRAFQRQRCRCGKSLENEIQIRILMDQRTTTREILKQIEAKIKICKKSRDWLYDVKVLFID